MSTSIERAIVEKLRTLSSQEQQQVLEFIEELSREDANRQPRHSLMGLFADPGMDITEEDIAEARREMWGNFPRDITE